MKLTKPQNSSSLYDDNNPDWMPSLHFGYEAAVPQGTVMCLLCQDVLEII